MVLAIIVLVAHHVGARPKVFHIVKIPWGLSLRFFDFQVLLDCIWKDGYYVLTLFLFGCSSLHFYFVDFCRRGYRKLWQI